MKIKKLFIANRAEIALRIARTASRLGISTVVPWHEADSQGPALALADERVQLHGHPPHSAYLDAQQIIEAAATSGCDAIAPGYGFLSENASFAAAVSNAGLVFVGPSVKALALMGDKIAARNFARLQDVPITPAVDEAGEPQTFAQRCAALGAPLLIKGAAGGGGKGMQIVRDLADLPKAIDAARAQSLRYFGDGRLLAERFVDNPRHIEVQIFGDHHGHVIHLGERECSIQRRFQKLIEEAPAPNLEPALRSRICQSAVRLGAAAGYVNAGTVEFIVSPQGEFFFLEINARLQVEHPVTEMCTGLDLVEWQLLVAQGQPLPLEQSQVQILGSAIEARVLAEDADAGFVPCTGQALLVQWPQGPGVRADGGIVQGARITADFDSLLGKIIAHGATRPLAITRLKQALAATHLLGVTVNTELLARVLSHPSFEAGVCDTGFLERFAAQLGPRPWSEEEKRAAIAVAVKVLGQTPSSVMSPVLAAMGPWRN